MPLRGDLNLHGLATAVVVDDIALNATHPVFILLGMGTVVHTWENHILGIDIAVFGIDNEVRVLLVFTALLLTAVDGRARLHTRHTHAVFLIEGHLRGVSLAVEQRAVAILVAAEIAAEGEDVLGRVLVHRRIGCRADDDERVARVAYHEHQHAEQRGVLDTR